MDWYGDIFKMLHTKSATYIKKNKHTYGIYTCIYTNYSQMRMKKQIWASFWVWGLENAEGK